MKHRSELIEELSNLDEEIVQAFMECDGDLSKISTADIKSALRRCTINGSAFPVYCGASFKNLGVQPLLDGVIEYLPSPDQVPSQVAKENDRNIEVKLTDPKMCALAFKVTYDAQRGPLVFVRVYSGSLDARTVLKVVSTTPSRIIGKHGSKNSDKERATKLLEMYADDYEEVSSIQAGNIGVVVGLRHVKTGDTLLLNQDPRKLHLHSITIPPTVFMRSVQVDSISEEKELHLALENLMREDPSLSLSVNEETGQTLLSGMGELHLEIAGERLLDVYKAKCILGKVEIAYRETIAGQSLSHQMLYDKEFFGKELKCDVTLVMDRTDNEVEPYDLSLTANNIYQGGTTIAQEVILRSNYRLVMRDIQILLR